MESSLRCHAIRLHPGDDLTKCLLAYVKQHDLKSAFILTCVGSVTGAHIRTANSVTKILVSGCHEIVSLVGTLSGGDGHLHICLSDAEGKTVAGHLLGDATIYTTAEVMIGELPDLEFTRPFDEETGFDELLVSKRS